MIVNAVVKDVGMIKLTLEALGLRVEPPEILPPSPRSVFSQDW